MASRVGELTSIVGCLIFLASLLFPYAIRPTYAVTDYYTYGYFNAFVAGFLVVLVLATAIAIRGGRLSTAFGAGVGLGLGIAALVFTTGWAITAREDVFLASGWLLPLQRYVLVGITALIVLGLGWQIHTSDAATA